MAIPPIIVVAGLGRCGSTLMMRMLHAGGMDVFCENKTDFETELIFTLPDNNAWLGLCTGKALKLLDPHENLPSPSFDYRFIWMDRNPREQAKSQMKLLSASMGIAPVNRRHARAMEASLRKEARTAHRICTAFGPTISIRFEDLLRHPRLTAKYVAEFLTRPLDIDAMARQVIDRPVTCLPYMLEEQMVSP